MRFALSAIVLMTLGGCFGEGCWDAERAETWHQAAYWDWVPDASMGLEVDDQIVEQRLPWPDPPASWRGNHTVVFVAQVVRSDYYVSVRDLRGEMQVWAFLPQKMNAADRAQAVRSTLQGATTASAAEIEGIVTRAMATDDGGDSTGRIMALTVPGLMLDLERLAAMGAWNATPERVAGWNLRHGDWKVFVELDSRWIRQAQLPYDDLQMDAGGHVRGPMLDAALDAAQRRANTTAFLEAVGAPRPSYEKAGTAVQQVCT